MATMLTELLINLGVLCLGCGLGYYLLPVFFKHNPTLTPESIAAHFVAVGKGYGAQAAVIIEAHAKAAIATIKAEAQKVGVTIA